MQKLLDLFFSRWTAALVCQEMRRRHWMLKPVHPQWAAARQSVLRAQERHGSHPKSCRSALQLYWSPPLTSHPWASAAPHCLLLLLHQQWSRWMCAFTLIWGSNNSFKRDYAFAAVWKLYRFIFPLFQRWGIWIQTHNTQIKESKKCVL